MAFCLALLMIAGCAGNDTPAEPLWTQVFGQWSCTAAGRPAWGFVVTRQSQFGSDHQWQDLDTKRTDAASVEETSVYLRQADQAFRNFEYKVVESEVLDHLEEWSLTANGAAPYVCVK